MPVQEMLPLLPFENNEMCGLIVRQILIALVFSISRHLKVLVHHKSEFNMCKEKNSGGGRSEEK